MEHPKVTRINLLVVSDYRDTLNAVRPEGRWFVELANHYGYQITVMTFREGANYLPELEAAGIRIIDWHPASKYGKADRAGIRAELQRGDYDILHLFNNKAIAAGVAAAKGWPGKVITYRGYTGNVHWWDPSAYFQHLNPRVDLITCVSPSVKEHFDRQLFFDPSKSVVVSKGHDPAWYSDVAPLDLHAVFNIPAEKVVVLILANAQKAKGMRYFGGAIRRMPAELPIHFLFVGRDLESTELLVDLADSPYHDQEDFTFLGHRTDALSILAASDINVLPSIKEGLNKVLLEGMFLGRPTIMTDISGNRGLGIDGETALIVAARDEDALVEAIVRLVEDRPLRDKLGTAGKAYITEHYRAERSAEALNRAYRQVIKG